MSGKNGRSLLGNGSFDLNGIYRESVRKNINEYWFTAFPYDTGSGGYIRKRCSDNLSLQIQGLDGELEGDGSVADEEQVIQSEVFL